MIVFFIGMWYYFFFHWNVILVLCISYITLRSTKRTPNLSWAWKWIFYSLELWRICTKEWAYRIVTSLLLFHLTYLVSHDMLNMVLCSSSDPVSLSNQWKCTSHAIPHYQPHLIYLYVVVLPFWVYLILAICIAYHYWHDEWQRVNVHSTSRNENEQ